MAGLTLYLLRHAKAVPHEAGTADFDRPLTARGADDASTVAGILAARRDPPGLILCSSAQRTRDTFAPLVARLAASVRVEITRDIYDADAESLLALIGQQDGNAPLLLIGHNPAIEMLASQLAGVGSDARALFRLRTKYPPAGLAVLEIDVADWRGIGAGRGRLTGFHTPGD